MYNAKYLMITIHDNDFTSYYHILGNTLLDVFRYAGYPTEEDIPELKELIKFLWYSVDSIVNLSRWKDTSIKHKSYPINDYFIPDIKIVNYFDIPKWGNGEEIYIPLFDGNDEILCV